MENRKIIFYDGDCVLCNRLCAFLLRRLDQHPYYFAMLYHSEVYREISLDLDSGLDSVVFLEGDKVFTHSDAVIEIFKQMDGPWKVLSVIRFIPSSIRDAVYRFIARHRKSFIGTATSCTFYNEQQRRRILY